MTITSIYILDGGLRRHWDGFARDRPQILESWTPINCADSDLLTTALDHVTEDTERVIITSLTSLLIENINPEYLNQSVKTIVLDLLADIQLKSSSFPDCEFYVASPVRVLLPRWYFTGFPSLVKVFQSEVGDVPANVHILPFHEVSKMLLA